MKYLLLPVLPFVIGLLSLAIAYTTGVYWWAFLGLTFSIALWIAKPRPRELDDKKFPTQQRMNELIEELKEVNRRYYYAGKGGFGCRCPFS